LANRDLNRLGAHTTLHQLAWGVSTAFSAVFLLRQGLSPSAIYLYIGLIIVLRFVFRPAVPFSVRVFGLRATMIAATFLFAVQSPLLALVHGPGAALLIYSAAAAIAQVFYWPCYHAMFAAVGDSERRGSQVGWRQLLVGIAGVAGPAAGGLMLTIGGPWLAFGAAALIELAAIAPLRHIAEPPFAPIAPEGAFRAAKRSTLLFASDGWIFNSSAWAWGLIAFQALGSRYDAFGGWLAAAALVGATGGLILGRFIDTGHARRAPWVNAATLAGCLVARSICGQEPIPVLAVAIGTALFGGLYMPSLMTAIYNEAKSSPCPLRFHLASEAGWDIGGALACLLAAAFCAYGASLQLIILLALPVVALQAFWLDGSYAARQSEISMAAREPPRP
jgi:MFS family permease